MFIFNIRFLSALSVSVILTLGLLIVPVLAQQLSLGAVRVGVILPDVPDSAVLRAAVSRSAQEGAILAEEEHRFNSELLGIDFAILFEKASDANVVAAADRLVEGGDKFST